MDYSSGRAEKLETNITVMWRAGSIPYFFVDDLFLFGEASETQAVVMENILQRFCAYSRQKVNMHKSKLFVSGNVGGTIAQAVSTKWNTPSTVDLGKYL